jgi:hypothetical protein
MPRPAAVRPIGLVRSGASRRSAYVIGLSRFPSLLGRMVATLSDHPDPDLPKSARVVDEDTYRTIMRLGAVGAADPGAHEKDAPRQTSCGVGTEPCSTLTSGGTDQGVDLNGYDGLLFGSWKGALRRTRSCRCSNPRTTPASCPRCLYFVGTPSHHRPHWHQRSIGCRHAGSASGSGRTTSGHRPNTTV